MASRNKRKKKGKVKSIQNKNNNSLSEQLFAKAQQLHQQGNLFEAERYYREVLKHDGAHFLTLMILAQIALEVGRYPLALKYAKQAVELNHADSGAHLIMAIILRELGLSDLAESEFTIAQQLKPDDFLIPNNLGLLYMQQGRVQAAEDAFRLAIKLNNKSPHAYYNLASNKKFTPNDGDIQHVEALRGYEGEYEDEEKSILHFTLGKIYHDCGRFDEAFEEYQQANMLKRSLFNYDPNEMDVEVENIISTFDEDFCNQLQNSGFITESPIFIVGMPRSGTTLVESLLCRHNSIKSIGEVPYIGNLLNGISQNKEGTLPDTHQIQSLVLNQSKHLGEQYMTLSRQFGIMAEHTIDKLPDNFLRIGFILSILPNAKIIHCVRDPLDTCLSIYQQYFTMGMKYAYTLEEIGRYYLQYVRIMEHWLHIFSTKIYELDYQQLVSDTDNELRKLIEFCDLEYNENTMSEGATHSIRTASAWQARQPVYQSSVKRWQRYEKHLGPWMDMLSPIIDEA